MGLRPTITLKNPFFGELPSKYRQAAIALDRQSNRLRDFDYSQAGWYFVTLACDQRRHLFGEIIGETMHLNQYGQCVDQTWRNLAVHFPVTLETWAIMPDHFHGVLAIRETSLGNAKKAVTVDQDVHPHGTEPGALNAIIQYFKSVTTRRINVLGQSPGKPVWQRNYYEHVIRNEAEWVKIAAYIENNPSQWRR